MWRIVSTVDIAPHEKRVNFAGIPLIQPLLMNHQTRIPPGIIPTTWLGRVSATLVAAGLAVVGLFFLAFALVAAALIAGIVIVRIWWALRKVRAQREAGVIEGSYSVETNATPAVISGESDPPVRPAEK
jgi:hypothetical protein